jgi:hypothetical protein
MGNAYPASGNQRRYSGSSSVRDNEDADLDSESGTADSESGTALVSLLEENARLRALVVQLSDLVLRNVVGQK